MKLNVIENGPIIVDTDGQVTVTIGGAAEEKKGPLFLCRCGQSATKPFCDGTHRKVDFEGAGSLLVVG